MKKELKKMKKVQKKVEKAKKAKKMEKMQVRAAIPEPVDPPPPPPARNFYVPHANADRLLSSRPSDGFYQPFREDSMRASERFFDAHLRNTDPRVDRRATSSRAVRPAPTAHGPVHPQPPQFKKGSGKGGGDQGHSRTVTQLQPSVTDDYSKLISDWTSETPPSDIVSQFKALQRQNSSFNSEWSLFAKRLGRGIRDPTKHPTQFLVDFLRTLKPKGERAVLRAAAPAPATAAEVIQEVQFESGPYDADDDEDAAEDDEPGLEAATEDEF